MNEFNNLGDIYAYVLKKLGKDSMGEYVSPNDFILAFNAIQVELINEYVSNFENSSEVTFDIAPFMKTLGDDEFPALTLSVYGKATIPQDAVYPARSNYTKYMNVGCTSSSEYGSVTLVSQMEYDSIMSQPMLNPLTNPLESSPIAVIQNGKIRVVPNIKKLVFSYIRLPKKIYFDYDEVLGDVVYLPAGSSHVNSSVFPTGTASKSIEPEWPLHVYPEISNRLVKYFAINQRSEFNLQTLEKPKV